MSHRPLSGRPATDRAPARPLSPLAQALHLALRGWRSAARPLLLALPAAGLAGTALAQSAPAAGAAALPGVEIIGTSPLPGQGVDRDLLPYSTQILKRDKVDRLQGANLTDVLNRSAAGVQVNDIQGSPFQGDLTFRGFRASPLLGAGQGLSVYLDGVRINEPFGDVVNFDLIPEFAVRTIGLVPGANPAFGLNSLGGALSYTTHDGRSAPGTRAELSYGSFARKKLSLSHGSSGEDGWHHYIAGSVFDENGWRDHSDGKLGSLFAKIGHDNGSSDWSVGLLLGRSQLVGNGLVPAYGIEDGGVLERDLYFNRRGAVYTHPDETENKLAQLSLSFNHALDAQSTLSGLVYLRSSQRDTINGDEAEEEEEDEAGGGGGIAPVAVAPGRARARAVVLAPGQEPDAAFNTTETRQTGLGAGLRYATTTGDHQWQVGAQLDASRSRYTQFAADGLFDASRGVQEIVGEERELDAHVRGKAYAVGVYASDTIKLSPRTHLTGTVRYNHAQVSNTLTTRDDQTDLVEAKPKESFTYNSLNPALGIAHRLADGPTLFANVARNTRVPTVIELGCADPDEPCRLPAGLQADPFLEQVKSTTVEAGLRWSLSRDTRLNLAVFRTTNRDDILFRTAPGPIGFGYFENFDKTRNQGLDAELSTRLGPVELSAAYSYLRATYEAHGVLQQGERSVAVKPGTRIAGLPKHTLKLGADWTVGGGWSLGADMLMLSARSLSGNEDGVLLEADPDEGEDAVRRRLKVPGYAVFNLRTAWQLDKAWGFYANVNNVFDKRYETFGAVAETLFDANGVGPGEERDAVFVAPGAPRSIFVGLRYRY